MKKIMIPVMLIILAIFLVSCTSRTFEDNDVIDNTSNTDDGQDNIDDINDGQDDTNNADDRQDDIDDEKNKNDTIDKNDKNDDSKEEKLSGSIKTAVKGINDTEFIIRNIGLAPTPIKTDEDCDKISSTAYNKTSDDCTNDTIKTNNADDDNENRLWYLNNNLLMDISIQGEISIKDSEQVDFLEIEMHYVVNKDSRQKAIIEKYFNEQGEKDGKLGHYSDRVKTSKSANDTIPYFFDYVNSTKLEYESYVRLEAYLSKLEIGEDTYPINDLSENLKDFTKNKGQVNQELTKQAKSLAKGEDNLSIIVENIANWIIENNGGTSEEISGIFITMLRSVDIPTRYVYGMTFFSGETKKEFSVEKAGWNHHVWAEVYFPSVGWVPFDITQQQYGLIDPTHIKLMDSLDKDRKIVSFRWKEIGDNVEIGAPRIDVHLINYEKPSE